MQGWPPGMHRELLKDRAAEADLIEIWMYSFENWGEVQADRYFAALERGMGTEVGQVSSRYSSWRTSSPSSEEEAKSGFP